MKTIEEIVDAARELDAAEFLRLRRKLDRLEQSIWEEERKRVAATMKRAKVTDEDIDRMVLRRRREGRP
jgi:hypothetical protein